ncbi:TonB-dependent receptor plug domain-containing protein [Achromobacter xylosoxidans]
MLAASLTTAWTAQAQNVGTAGVPAPTLAPITVIDRSNQGSMRPGALRDELVKTESISERAIAKAGATNVNEALDKNPGIAVQVECSICNVRNILLNNLPGRYTTLMIDGVPIFSSVSSAYGLDSVSVYGVERIDVARGAGASLIAPEALSGSVNIVTKRPTEAENRARAQIGSYGSRQGDAYLARPFEGGAITATLNYNKHDSVDADHNGISEYTGYDRRLGGIGFFLDDAGGFKVRGRLDVVNENAAAARSARTTPPSSTAPRAIPSTGAAACTARPTATAGSIRRTAASWPTTTAAAACPRSSSPTACSSSPPAKNASATACCGWPWARPSTSRTASTNWPPTSPARSSTTPRPAGRRPSRAG